MNHTESDYFQYVPRKHKHDNAQYAISSFMCSGATKKEMKLDIYMGKHASLSSCFFLIMFILISIINCSAYQDFISRSFKPFLSRVCQIFWSSHSTFFPLAMLVLFMFFCACVAKKRKEEMTTFID